MSFPSNISNIGLLLFGAEIFHCVNILFGRDWLAVVFLYTLARDNNRLFYSCKKKIHSSGCTSIKNQTSKRKSTRFHSGRDACEGNVFEFRRSFAKLQNLFGFGDLRVGAQIEILQRRELVFIQLLEFQTLKKENCLELLFGGEGIIGGTLSKRAETGPLYVLLRVLPNLANTFLSSCLSTVMSGRSSN